MTERNRSFRKYQRVAIFLFGPLVVLTVVAAMSWRLITLYNGELSHDLNALLDRIAFGLMEIDESVAAATRRIASSPEILGPLKEEDPFRLVIALNQSELVENLDVCFLQVLAHGKPSTHFQGRNLKIFEATEKDLAFEEAMRQTAPQHDKSAVLDGPDGWVVSEHLPTPSTGKPSPPSGYPSGFYVFRSAPILYLGKNRGTVSCGKRIAPNNEFSNRLKVLAGLSGDVASALAIYLEGQAVIKEGSPELLVKVDGIVSRDLHQKWFLNQLGNMKLMAKDTFHGRGRIVVAKDEEALKGNLLQVLSFMLLAIVAIVIAAWHLTTTGEANLRLEKQILERERNTADLKRAHAEAHLNMLRIQMQPHFLFNTLNTIYHTVLFDAALARNMLADLAELLRVILDSSNHALIPIRAELRIVDLYLKLQRQRHGDRLRFQFHYDERALDAAPRLPPLLLQTLVENAVKHGIDGSLEGGVIVLSIEVTAAETKITVLNSGAKLQLGKVKGTGLNNTRERLQLAFGARAQFELFSNERDETIAQISILKGPT